jgi:hypothetical protein
MATSEFGVLVKKKTLLAMAYHAEIVEQTARIESLKAQWASSIYFDECASRLSFVSAALMELSDADDDGNVLRATCPGCGRKLFDAKDVYGNDAMVYHCICQTEFKIEKRPGGRDLTPEFEEILNMGGKDGERKDAAT